MTAVPPSRSSLVENVAAGCRPTSTTTVAYEPGTLPISNG